MMDPLPAAICYLAALVCFLIATLGVVVTERRPLNLVALGLAFSILPLLWEAMSAA